MTLKEMVSCAPSEQKAAASRTATAKTASLQTAAAVREGTSRPQIQGTDRSLQEVSMNILVPLKYDVIQY